MNPPCTVDSERCIVLYKPDLPLPDCCRGHLRATMRAVAEQLDLRGVTWWLDYGSLLGAVRNPRLGLAPGIIPHDRDADIGFLAEDWPAVMRACAALEEAGFMVTQQEPRLTLAVPWQGGDYMTVYRSAKNRTNVDLFPWYHSQVLPNWRGRHSYCSVDRFKGREFPERYLLPVVRTAWEDMELPVPRRAEWFVQHRYGPQWLRPITTNNDGVPR